MATMFHSPFTLAHGHSTSYLSSSRAQPFTLQHAPKKSALQLIVYLALVIGLYRALPLLFPVPLSGQLIGHWQLQTQVRNGRRVRISSVHRYAHTSHLRPDI